MGTTMAYYFSERFNKVIVLEQNQIGYGASGTISGILSLMERESNLQLELSLKTLEIYKELEENNGADFEFLQEGGMALLDSENLIKGAKKIINNLKKNNLDVKMLCGEKQIKKVQPALNFKNIKALAYCASEGVINPFKTIFYFAKEAKKNGVEFIENAKVIGFKKKGSRIESVLTNDKNYYTDLVIVATGAWTYDLMKTLGYDIPVYFNKGVAMVTQPTEKIIHGAIVSGDYLTGEFKNQSINIEPGFVQTKNGNIVLAQITTKETRYNNSVDFSLVPNLVRKCLKCFPQLKNLNLIRSWGGTPPYTDDGLPVYGLVPNLDNLILSVAFKGAFSIAPAVGLKTAKIIAHDGDFIKYKNFFVDRFFK
jgi:sarcosine oxidase subunit beta